MNGRLANSEVQRGLLSERATPKRTAGALGLGLLICLGASHSWAQTPEQGPVRMPAFGRSLASGTDSTALVQNPANLGFLPSAELRWTGAFLNKGAEVPWQGHAFALAVPIPFLRAATGVRVDAMNPPRNSLAPGAAPYEWLTWGVAVKLMESTSLGFSAQRSYSEMARWHGLATWSAGLTTRPWNGLALAVVAENVTAPKSDSGGFIDRSFGLGAAIRPLGTRQLEVGLETRYIDAPAPYWVPRATLGVDVPSVGRLRADVQVSDPEEKTGKAAWLATAGLAVNLNSSQGSTELGAGAAMGNALGAGHEAEAGNLYADVAIKGYREPSGVPAKRAGVVLRIEDTPGARQHVALLRRLWQVAEQETSVDAVVLELRAPPARSYAAAQELRDAIRNLRLHGKRVLCHLEEGGGAALYVCSAANRTLLNPSGMLRFAGLRARHFYFASLLHKLGIRAEVTRIGAHKSAPETFMREGSSDVARADSIDLLQQYERYLVGGIASGRGLSVEQVRERIAKGPFIAQEAIAAGFVDGVAFDDQVEEEAQKLVGRSLVFRKLDQLAPKEPRRFGRGGRLAIVYANGNIVDGRSSKVPFLGMETVGSYSMAETLADVRQDDTIRAVVLRIDSPGGSSMASDVMWREVELLARRKPVIVSMGGVAASGGYYIAVPATRIFANPLTVTGSIGVFAGKADVSELIRRIGVNVEVYKTAPRADAESTFRPLTADESQELQRKVGQFYDQFVTRVATGRHLQKAQVDAVGQGRVWTGEQASVRGLVDELGGLRQALDYARGAADPDLPDYAPIVELPLVRTSLVGKLLGIEGLRAEAMNAAIPPQFAPAIRAMGPFLLYPEDRPLALLDLVEDLGP